MALGRDDQDDARRHFERALAVEPGYIPSSLALANLAYRNGEWAVAHRLAREVLSRQGNHAHANYVAGVSAAKLFQLRDAQLYLERAIALDPTNVQYSNALLQVGVR